MTDFMKHLWLNAYADIVESVRSRWFMVYTAVFGGLVVLLFAYGVTESRIMGFTGLWEEWTDKETGEIMPSATIIVTAANDLLRLLSGADRVY